MFKRSLIAVAAALALAAPPALAQPALSSLLPETTVLALHVSPEGFDPTTLEALFSDLDVGKATEALSALGGLLGDADLAGAEEPVDLLEEIAAGCPELAAALRDVEPALGPTVLGVSVSRFDPMPGLVAATRPADPGLAARLLQAAVGCLDGTELGVEGDSPLYLLADGSDMPLILAETSGTLIVATDPELARGAVRRSGAAGERGFANTRLGALSSGMTSRGLAVSLNLAAAADALELYRGALGDMPEAAPLAERFLTTLRVVGGFAWHVTADAGGLLVESVAAFDERLAEQVGEEALLALLTCSDCLPAEPTLLPRDAVAISGGAFSLRAFVDWVDSWLASAGELGVGGADLRDLLGEVLGVDVDAALLGWLGESWHAATLDVLGTDLRGWLQGLPTVVTVPVTSEPEARRGVALWPEALQGLGELVGSLGAEGPAGDVRLEDAVSFRERAYRGVEYLRVRSGPTLDLGVAVFGGQLVVGWPVESLHAAIDVHLGTPQPAGTVWRTLEGLDLGAGGVVGYRLTDTSAFLRGIADVWDLAAGSVATAAWLGVNEAAELLEGEGGASPTSAPPDLPSFDDLIGLADLVAEALELLADRTGVAVGTSEVRDGVRWSTWRLPLR